MNDKILMEKASYLNLPFFSIRMVICVGLWSLMSFVLVRKFKEQENFPERAERIQESLGGLSAAFMIIFAVTYSMASFDWIMSLEPHWFSTIFGVFTFSGLVVSGLATLILVLIHLQHHGYLKDMNLNHYHDLGKLLLGFTTFWAYIWFSQYLLIWYANIPEESEYYVLREHFGWSWLFWINIVLNWVIPFLVLLPRWTKRNKTVLQRTCLIILLGQWLNLYVMIAPKVMEHHGVMDPTITWIELFIALGYTGLFLFIFFKKLSQSSLVATNSPFLEEGLALEQ
jgi:MFS family permease